MDLQEGISTYQRGTLQHSIKTQNLGILPLAISIPSTQIFTLGKSQILPEIGQTNIQHQGIAESIAEALPSVHYLCVLSSKSHSAARFHNVDKHTRASES